MAGKEVVKAKAGASDGVDDGKRYWVTVSRPVHIMGNMWWRPSHRIQSDGHLIRALMDKPENEGRITLGDVVAEDEVT